MNRHFERLTSQIAIGMHDHVSIGHIDEDGNFGGGNFGVDVISEGIIEHPKGMFVDLRDYKKAVREVLERYHHGLIISDKQKRVKQECRERAMYIIETSGGTIEGLPVVIFDSLRRAIHEPTQLKMLRLKTPSGTLWEARDEAGIVQVDRAKQFKKRSMWACELDFGHRIVGLGKCENPHSHTWIPKVRFNRELNPEEYQRITKKIESKLKKSWNGRGVFYEKDDFSDALKTKRKPKKLSSNPTTEVISRLMIREIIDVLKQESSDIILAHFELWETPTNFVTT